MRQRRRHNPDESLRELQQRAFATNQRAEITAYARACKRAGVPVTFPVDSPLAQEFARALADRGHGIVDVWRVVTSSSDAEQVMWDAYIGPALDEAEEWVDAMTEAFEARERRSSMRFRRQQRRAR